MGTWGLLLGIPLVIFILDILDVKVSDEWVILKNYIENEKMKKQQEKELKNSYFNEKLKLIAELELQLKDLRYVDSNEELEEYKIKYDVFEKSRKQKEKNRIEKIEKCKIDITLYMKNNKDTFKLKNMLYDLKINNKTFYNYELDEFIKNLEKK